MNSQRLEVSVIMPALNEAHRLGAAFDSIEALRFPQDRIEVILVDNGSTDATVRIAQERGARVFELPGARIGALRNLGARKARGEILAFLDSDCSVDPAWLDVALRHLSDPGVGATGGHTRPPVNPTWMEATLDFLVTREGVNDVDFLPSANLILRREVFERANGFDTRLETGEDSDLSERIRALGLRLVSDTDILVVHHDYPKTFWQRVKKEMWHSANLMDLLRSTGFRAEYLVAIGVPLAYLLCLLGGCAFLVCAAYGGTAWSLLYAAACFLSLPTAIALYKAIRKRRFAFVHYSAAYYAAVLLGRIAALIRFVIVRIGRPSREAGAPDDRGAGLSG
jgi:glycosyltransferase involved in cell wall biosynthesis